MEGDMSWIQFLFRAHQGAATPTGQETGDDVVNEIYLKTQIQRRGPRNPNSGPARPAGPNPVTGDPY